jgi:hypothetical protein
MYKLALKVAGAALLAWGATPASAQTVEARSPATVEAALAGAGYSPEMKKDSGGDPLIVVTADGYKVIVMFFGCKNNADCKSVSFYAAYRAPKKIDLQAINAWNQKRRFGRAFLDNDGDPTLQFEVDLDDGGMSKALFIDNLEWFTVAFDNLKTELK